MEKWLKKNLKWITLALVFLFSIKSFQSCNRKATIRIQNKNLSEQCDSLLQIKDQIIKEKNLLIDSLDNEILTREFIIKDLSTELKIAGIKYDEAQKRAEAIQRTAERIRTNTTIEIEGAERDTIKK
jgi:hypothetical protein